jgi:Domain of unknown function (DUF4136)
MRFWTVMSAMLMLAGCASISVQDDFDPGADFGGYRSFSWVADAPLLVATPQLVNPQLESHLTKAALATLQAKGYEFVADREAADFLLGFTVGPRTALDPQQYPDGYRGQVVWQGSAGPATTSGDPSMQLSVNIYDVATRAPVWRGTVQRNVTGRDQANAETVLRRVIEAVLARFPPT